MELDGLTGRVYKITDWILVFVTVNIIWFIFNLPIVYLSISMLLIDEIEQYILLVTMILMLTPFVFFPSTTAMFGVIRKKILDDEVELKIVKSFWFYYKDNYKHSVIGGCIISFLWVILAVDYYFFAQNLSELFSYLFIALSLILFVFTLYFFAVTVHVYSGIVSGLRNAIFFTFGNPVISFGIGLISVLFIYVSFQISTFFIPFFLGSLIAYISFLGFVRVFKNIQP
ncbi:YesL family protein [Aquibacillus salsiterrae]|uniref:DUF624 domain-containing protein n=1 Tax=Aquibacillus salsiterrae TaxID=2950439 RepID=A0A9X4AEI8_9BACI|nr:DUF624 domain-containing protein [Aquibacillus salsiterrae]MDC3416619.1 DUF624 domain-containing protein [Aquibacillus salsiterrae]